MAASTRVEAGLTPGLRSLGEFVRSRPFIHATPTDHFAGCTEGARPLSDLALAVARALPVGQGRAGGKACGEGHQSSGGSRVIALLGWLCPDWPSKLRRLFELHPDPIISGAGIATPACAAFGDGSCAAVKLAARISACRTRPTASQVGGRRGLGATSTSDCSLSNCWRFRRFRRPKRRATDRPHCRPGYTPIGRN